jgi:hypothetical protein
VSELAALHDRLLSVPDYAALDALRLDEVERVVNQLERTTSLDEYHKLTGRLAGLRFTTKRGQK